MRYGRQRISVQPYSFSDWRKSGDCCSDKFEATRFMDAVEAGRVIKGYDEDTCRSETVQSYWVLRNIVKAYPKGSPTYRRSRQLLHQYVANRIQWKKTLT